MIIKLTAKNTTALLKIIYKKFLIPKMNTIINVILDNLKIFYILLYSTLIFGFFLNENTLGGSISDFAEFWRMSNLFARDFLSTIQDYNLTGHRQSPVHLIWQSLFIRLNISETLYRLLNLHLSLLLILSFYKVLKLKFNKTKNNILILTSAIIFLSPSFRSSAIWPDSYIFALLFFVISIFFYLKFEISKAKKLSYALLNIFFLAISSYITPNFCFFSIFFFYKFWVHFKKSLNLYILITTNLLLAYPAFYFLYILKINFLIPTASSDVGINIFSMQNLSNKILCTSSIIFFHLLSFFLVFYKDIKKKIKKIDIFYLIFLIIFTTVLYSKFNYEIIYKLLGGGGIFYKISYITQTFYLFFVISFISIYILIKIITNNLQVGNIILIITLFIFQPQTTIYHNYFEPLILILIFSLFNLKINSYFKNNLNITILYICSLLFLIINLLRIFF
jgi:hypothetical protein